MKCLSSYILPWTILCHALMAVFRIVSDLFRALQLHFYQVKYMTSHIAGSPDDRILKSKAITIVLVKKEG